MLMDYQEKAIEDIKKGDASRALYWRRLGGNSRFLEYLRKEQSK